jgi:hypothetical protein
MCGAGDACPAPATVSRRLIRRLNACAATSAAIAEFDAALQTLNQSVPAIKRRIVVACAACILANQQVTVREAELLRAICDTLDCPLPPLVVREAEGR